jgi:DNA-directed RNA polymerase subunit K/omega
MDEMNESDYYSESDSKNDSENEVYENKKKPIKIKSANTIEEEEEEEEEERENKIIAIDPEEEEENENEDDEEIEEEDDEEIEDEDDEDEDIELNEEGEPIEKNMSLAKQKKETKKKATPILLDQEEEEEEDDEYDEHYLQKFDSEVTKNYVNEFHPECFMHNYEEISKLSIVVRNSDNVVIDPLHKTIPYLTKYEKARILGQRAKQLEAGAKPFIKVPENIVECNIIAELELREKKIPFIIKRPIPGGGSEYWKIIDLENIDF